MKYTIQAIGKIIKASGRIANDATIATILTDSRSLFFPEETLFFALKGRTNDGHKYVRELYKLKVRNFVVQNFLPEFESMVDANFLVVKDSLAALQKLAQHHRKQFSYPVIAITGSNGKTTVKEFLFQLLHEEFNIVRSPRSYNSQLGVPLSIWQMSEQNTLGIFEAGISQPNEMELLNDIIRPTIGVITNIGEAHQENFISTSQKCMEKLQLFVDCETIIYNADDPLISQCLEASLLSHKAIGWSRTNDESPLYVEAIEKQSNQTVIHCTLLGLQKRFVIPFTDDASIEDVIHCIALILYLKPTMVNEVERFTKLEPVAMRLEEKQGRRGCTLINDTYNSDLNSLTIALDFLVRRSTDKQLKRTVILSDILQTGTLPKSLYKKVANLLERKHIDHFIGVGRDLVEMGHLFEMEKNLFRTTEELLESEILQKFDHEMILVKGSRMFHFERVVEKLEAKVYQTILEVDLDAVVHNFNHYRSLLPNKTKIIAMVKAGGYGTGGYQLAKTLQEHHCDYLAVALADEGAAMRREGISIPIIVMNPEFGSFDHIFEYSLEPEIYSFKVLEEICHEANRRGIANYPIHIKIDTGMHRLGFSPSDMSRLGMFLKNRSGVKVRSVFSHFAAADVAGEDQFSKMQYDRLCAAKQELEEIIGYKPLGHILNTAGIERFSEYALDMARLGIGLYGLSPTDQSGLMPVATLKTQILQIKDIPQGDTIGYSRRGKAEKTIRIAILPIGYADGFNRQLGNGVGEVLVNGKRCPTIGNICMDTCMINISDVEANEGDPVILFGEGLPITEIAEKLGTISYEVLTSVSERVKRVYYKG